MQYDIEKRKTLSHAEQKKYISAYHDWLDGQREKDRDRHQFKKTERGRAWLRKNKCPYCYKRILIEHKGGVTHKICKKHGILQVMKD